MIYFDFSVYLIYILGDLMVVLVLLLGLDPGCDNFLSPTGGICDSDADMRAILPQPCEVILTSPVTPEPQPISALETRTTPRLHPAYFYYCR